MKRSSTKHLLLIAFAFIGSYATSVIVFPFSYWQSYFNMPVYRIVVDILLNVVLSVLMLAISLYIDRKLNKRIPWELSPLKRLLIQTLFQVLGVLVLLILLSIFLILVHLLFGDFLTKNSPAVNLKQGADIIILLVLWALMVSTLNTGDFLLNNWKAATLKAAEFEIKAAQNKQHAAEVELQALKLQLDPHFVFNNLSVLSELILKDQQLGYEYTENFAKVYRYLLSNSKKQLIPLREELKFLEAYLFLLQNRMAGGVVFRIEIDESRLDLLIPPVTLQLLIENALKHNRREAEHPLVIEIYSHEEEQELVVANTLLPLIKAHNSTGIGLKNIMSRYAFLADKKPYIEKSDKLFTVKIPLIK